MSDIVCGGKSFQEELEKSRKEQEQEKETQLFDPQFVYFMWDNELEGKECFVSTGISTLIQYVNDDHVRYKVYRKVDTNEIMDGTYTCWNFAYYDPNYDCKKAFLMGEPIEHKESGVWKPCQNPMWIKGVKYRVAKNRKPFGTVSELIEFWESNYGNINRPKNTFPLIWVKFKTSNDISLIQGYNEDIDAVYIHGDCIGLTTLFQLYTFLDGRTIGR